MNRTVKSPQIFVVICELCMSEYLILASVIGSMLKPIYTQYNIHMAIHMQVCV